LFTYLSTSEYQSKRRFAPARLLLGGAERKPFRIRALEIFGLYGVPLTGLILCFGWCAAKGKFRRMAGIKVASVQPAASATSQATAMAAVERTASHEVAGASQPVGNPAASSISQSEQLR
jgi:hypothetical protein